jgi:cyclic lactone autoinducer peptide
MVYVSLWLSLLECALFFLSTAAANERCIGAMFDEGKYESKLKG